MAKKALITGIAGQDGSYLSELLIKKGYEVHGIVKKESLENAERLKNISSFKDKIFVGEVDFVSSRINADTRSLLSRIKVENQDLELISGSLLEVSVKFDLRNSLSVPDTSVMIEGDKSYVYKINKENIANKTEIKTGIRIDKRIEIISGLTEGDIIVAEGLKKVRPRGKIKPINK